jgi:integrase
MKVKDKNFDDFKMPLSEELINIFKEQKDLTGYQTWVFLGTNHRTSINVESPNKALKIMGFDDESNGRKITLHGFRGTFRSMIETLDVNNQFSFEIKERALDHQESSKVVRAYAHKADYIKQLSLLMNYWSDFILSLKNNN